MQDLLKTWVINDYFTPNIKAEVLLDTLLTPYIPQILKSQYEDMEAVFLTKEMSISETPEDKETEDNRGSKIDYVLTGKNRDAVYLVELKTTDSSIDKDQLSLYTALADRTRTFGEVLGKRLLGILAKSFQLTDFGTQAEWNGDEKLEEMWREIWDKRKWYDPTSKVPEASESYERMAMELIRAKGWAWRGNLRSRKYVYTLGQLMDYLHGPHGAKGLWNRTVELVYLTPWLPENRALFSEKIRPAAFVPYFEENQPDTPLTDIIKDIYGGA